jgi:hypothetical protein
VFRTLRRIPAAVMAVLAVLLLGASLSAAQSAVAPATVAPTAGKSLARGVPFTFKVRVDPQSEQSGVFLKVSKSKRVGADGTLASAVYFRSMTASGSGGLWVKKVERYASLPSHFLNRRGRYYWQAYAIDCSGGDLDDCNVEGPIASFRIK